MHHSLLCSCQFEGQVVLVEVVECIAHLWQQVALVFLAVVGCIPQYVELHIEQLLKLQSLPCMLQFILVVGVVHQPHCLVSAHQVQGLGDIVRQGFRQGRDFL